MTRSVLVVEEYADLRAAIVNALSRGHYTCDHVTTSDEAIAKLRSRHYETILLAPTLPISSDPVMHFLAEEQPDQVSHVILMAEPDVEEQPMEASQRVLLKPFNHEELLTQVRRRRKSP